MSKLALPLCLALLLVAAGAWRTADSAARTSITIDEHQHIYGGYRFLRTGKTLNRADVPDEHPPLGRILLGVPLLGLDLTLPDESVDHSEAGGRFTTHLRSLSFVFENRAPGPLIVQRARTANIALGALFGILLFAGGCWLMSPWRALLALLLFVACPNLAAHAAVATTDLPGALTFFAASLGAAAFAARPSLPRAALLGTLLAIALLTKLTALALAPAVLLQLALSCLLPDTAATGALAWLEARFPGPRVVRAFFVRASGLCLTAVLLLATLWMPFGFRDQPLGAAIRAQETRPAETILLALRETHLLPDPFWMALFVTVAHGSEAAHQSYLLGETSYAGHPLYYLIALAVKLPLPTLMLVAIGIVGLAVTLVTGRCANSAALLLAIPPAVLAAMLASAHLNIGVRHALALFPFLLLAAATTGHALPPARSKTILLTVLGLLSLASSLRSHPFELAYFNEAAGGTRRGHRYLADSNLDWGQGLMALAQWARTHDANGRMWLSAFGLPVASAYGIDAEELPSPSRSGAPLHTRALRPGREPAWLVVSSNELLGLYRDSPSPWRGLLARKPVVVLGGSLWVFDARGDASLRALVGDAWREGRDAERARIHYVDALEVDPAEPRASAGLVHLAIGSGDFALAARLLEEGQVESAPMLVAEARLALAQNRVAAATAALSRATALEPAAYDAQLLLALTILNRGGDLQTGETAATRASELAPGLPAPWDALASYRARADDFAAAAGFEQRAIEHTGGGPALEQYRERLRQYRQHPQAEDATSSRGN